MTFRVAIFLFLLLVAGHAAGAKSVPVNTIRFDFYGDTISLSDLDAHLVDTQEPLTQQNVTAFYEEMNNAGFDAVVASLLRYKQQHRPDDWIYYQLIRRTAQYLSPKDDNYHRYTLYKWYFLAKTGYDATLTVAGDRLLFYVQCDENIYDIPSHMRNGRQYVCLNYHDYNGIDLANTRFTVLDIRVPEAQHGFSYKLTRMPEFSTGDYEEKELSFDHKNTRYTFKVKLNTKVKNIFTNYPVADYQLYFNTPLSSETYNSLIPQLKESVYSMGTREGVDYLMRFTRYAFLYKPDGEHFGKEKRLLPEQTLLYEGSDCEDRAALFFYLVKEIYALPMIVLAYPGHVSIAVKFDKPIGTPIIYNGEKYSLCEPTPQRGDVPIGAMPRELRSEPYEVALVYDPK
ncbi:hypothetical protein GCM10023093_19020 [Nemorincola caseinilytica]|uniref:Transglutaminase domain-containing protein n=1 Tax=Nemorincola caseinilytica TaxID=2054315 RepID=A0ABP8NF40_9BACT